MNIRILNSSPGTISDNLSFMLIGPNIITMDYADRLRVNMFTDACEKTAKSIIDTIPTINRNGFIELFCFEIVLTPEYVQFSNFCEIEQKGIEAIAIRILNMFSN